MKARNKEWRQECEKRAEEWRIMTGEKRKKTENSRKKTDNRRLIIK